LGGRAAEEEEEEDEEQYYKFPVALFRLLPAAVAEDRLVLDCSFIAESEGDEREKRL
jgi:hypothetical protein